MQPDLILLNYFHHLGHSLCGFHILVAYKTNELFNHVSLIMLLRACHHGYFYSVSFMDISLLSTLGHCHLCHHEHVGLPSFCLLGFLGAQPPKCLAS